MCSENVFKSILEFSPCDEAVAVLVDHVESLLKILNGHLRVLLNLERVDLIDGQLSISVKIHLVELLALLCPFVVAFVEENFLQGEATHSARPRLVAQV